jgi:RecJ-like exonuclease
MIFPALKRMTKGSTGHERRNRFVMPVALLVFLLLVGQVFWLNDNRDLFAPFSIQKIPCEKCAHRGTVRNTENQRIVEMCPACFGLGYHMVRYFDDNDVVCAACGGMGRLDKDGTWRTCNRCDGRGLHRADEWQQEMNLEKFNNPENPNPEP